MQDLVVVALQVMVDASSQGLFFPSTYIGGDLIFVLVVTRVCVMFYFFFLLMCDLFMQRPEGNFEDFVLPRCNVIEN